MWNIEKMLCYGALKPWKYKYIYINLPDNIKQDTNISTFIKEQKKSRNLNRESTVFNQINQIKGLNTRINVCLSSVDNIGLSKYLSSKKRKFFKNC